MTWDLPDITEVLRKLAEDKLIFDPLVGGLEKNMFSPIAQERLKDAADRLLAKCFGTMNSREAMEARAALFDTYPVSDRLVYSCMHEFLFSAAAYTSHDLKGRMDVDEEIALMAINDVTSFLDTYGFKNLFWCYVIIIGYENQQAVDHYGRIAERDFLYGSNHRPWISYRLDDELLIGLAFGIYKIVLTDNQRYVELTDFGRKRLKETRRMLIDSNYIDARTKVMYVTQFDQLFDWEDIVNQIMPTSTSFRKGFLDYINIQSGMKVLELGCGTGAFTVDAGLYRAVGPTGWVTATEPSAGMINRLQRKLYAKGITNVAMETAVAEEIPYGDAEFDASVGVAFFHFTDNDKALSEMKRVTRKGGVVAIVEALEFNFNVPFFREWFDEFFELAKKRGHTAPPSYLYKPKQLHALFEEHGLVHVDETLVPLEGIFNDPKTVVRWMVQGVGLFQQEMVLLPWKARIELIDRLIVKGKEICEKYSLEERTIHFPMVYVKGTVM